MDSASSTLGWNYRRGVKVQCDGKTGGTGKEGLILIRVAAVSVTLALKVYAVYILAGGWPSFSNASLRSALSMQSLGLTVHNSSTAASMMCGCV